MEWLDNIMKVLVEDETKRKEATEQIKKELGLQFIPKATFNEVNTELKAMKEQSVKTEATIAELTGKAKTAEEKDAIIKQMQEETATFKAETEKRMANTKKLAELQVNLSKEVSPDAVDLLASTIDLEKVELKDDKIANYEALVTPLRESRKSLFTVEHVDTSGAGDRTRKPGEDKSKMSDEEYYASVKMPKLI